MSTNSYVNPCGPSIIILNVQLTGKIVQNKVCSQICFRDLCPSLANYPVPPLNNDSTHMSQSEVAKLQSHKDARVKVEQYNDLSLRALAPKPLPRLRPLAIKGKSETSVASLRGQQSVPSARKKKKHCMVCFSRSCKLVSHQYRVSNSPRPRRTNQPSTKADRDEAYSASYSLQLMAWYTIEHPPASRLDPFHKLPLPPDLNTIDMLQLFHNCR